MNRYRSAAGPGIAKAPANNTAKNQLNRRTLNQPPAETVEPAWARAAAVLSAGALRWQSVLNRALLQEAIVQRAIVQRVIAGLAVVLLFSSVAVAQSAPEPPEAYLHSGSFSGPYHPLYSGGSGLASQSGLAMQSGMASQSSLHAGSVGPGMATAHDFWQHDAIDPQSESYTGEIRSVEHEHQPWMVEHERFGAAGVTATEAWDWHLLPDGLIYRSYLAGRKEPRLASMWMYDKDQGWVWDIALGGRVGLLRYGTTEGSRPDGWQLDVEGAAFPRLDIEEERDMVSADFRAGIPLTYGVGRYQMKFAYYHLSSHLGDEYMLKNPGARRLNYSRDELVWGHSYYATPDLRLYGEIGWAFLSDVAEPWEYQFGIDYSPVDDRGFRGAPFWALNAHLRQENDFGGNMVAQFGWQWRQSRNGQLFRAGIEYFNGKDDQFEFYDNSVEKIGFGVWYDF